MKRFTKTAAVCVALATFSVHAQADVENNFNSEVAGPYIGVGFGAAFGNREIDDSDSRNDEDLGNGAKIYLGYQLSEHFGVQVGYVRMRDLNQNRGKAAQLVKRTATGHSEYLAGTARLPLGRSFALTGKLGVAIGAVTDTRPSTGTTRSLRGNKTSLLVGTGVEYVFNDTLSFSIELESYGKISNAVKGNTLTIGTRFTF